MYTACNDDMLSMLAGLFNWLVNETNETSVYFIATFAGGGLGGGWAAGLGCQV